MLITGARYRVRLERALDRLGADVLWLSDNPDVDPRLAGHADLGVLIPAEGRVIAAPGVYNGIVNILTNRGYTVVPSSPQGAVYPADAGLCVCRVGRFTICNPGTVDPVAARHLTGETIAVTQGYTRCAVCVVSDGAIITSDDVIAERAANAGLDVLRISPGYIRLDGFPYGFIGGASLPIGRDCVAFTGRLDGHPDGAAIEAFLRRHGKTPLYLTDEPVFDIGGGAALP